MPYQRSSPYFPTKEDLVYSRLEAFEEALLAAIRERRAGESVLDAFGRFVLERSREGASRDLGKRVATTARIITASPALLARERRIVAAYAEALAGLIAEELEAEGERALALLAEGLGDYAVKPG